MSVEDAARVMSQHQIRRLPIVDEDKLVGMVSLGDLAVNNQSSDEAGQALKDISNPAEPKNEHVHSNIPSFRYLRSGEIDDKGVLKMPLLEISIVPVGTDSPSFSSQVIDEVRVIEEKNIKYEVTPTSTVLEGEIDDLWEVAKEMHQKALEVGPERIVTNIKIDHRTDKQMDMDKQIDKVEKQLS